VACSAFHEASKASGLEPSILTAAVRVVVHPARAMSSKRTANRRVAISIPLIQKQCNCTCATDHRAIRTSRKVAVAADATLAMMAMRGRTAGSDDLFSRSRDADNAERFTDPANDR